MVLLLDIRSLLGMRTALGRAEDGTARPPIVYSEPWGYANTNIARSHPVSDESNSTIRFYS